MKPSLSLRASVQSLLCLICVLLCSSVWAQEAKVRVSLATNETVWVGQKVTVAVELLAPGYFASAATFDLPDPQGMLLIPPTDHPVVSSETVEDVNYTVQRHEVSVFAQRAGDQTIPTFKVRFAFKRAPLDTNEVAAAVTTSPLPITVASPPGAESLGNVISARNLKVEETWQPEPGKTNVMAGAAFQRTITFSAPEVPGMVFPPFPAGEIDGLGIYIKRQLNDHSDRGSLTGERHDVITYVCKRPGQFTIPATRLIWFDLETKQLQTNKFLAYTLTVLPNPALTANAGTNGVVSRTGPGQITAATLPSFVQRHWLSVFVTTILVVVGRIWSWRRVGPQLLFAMRPIHLAKLNPSNCPDPQNSIHL